MSSLDDTFETILGRKADPEEKQYAYWLIKAVGVSENDSFAIFVIMFFAFDIRFRSIPDLMVDAAKDILQVFRIGVEAEAARANAQAKQELFKAVAQASTKVAATVSRTQNYQWLAGMTAVITISLIGAIWTGYNLGHQSGYGDAIDQNRITSWGNSKEGREAYQLYLAGSIHKLATCSVEGWQEKGNVCYPAGTSKGMYGYNLRQ